MSRDSRVRKLERAVAHRHPDGREAEEGRAGGEQQKQRCAWLKGSL